MAVKFSLLAGTLLSSLVAGTLAAQAPPSKPTPRATNMQHAPAAQPVRQDSARLSTTGAKVQHAAWTKDQIKEAQSGLAKAGFYRGEPNGVLNRRTRKAIRAYQKANKLPVTGRLNNELLTKLRSS